MLGEIEKELQELITKNLPAQVGNELQKVLAKGKKDAEEVERLTKIIEDKEETIRIQSSNNTMLQEKLNKAGDIEAREKAVAEAERNIKIKQLEYELKAEQDKTTFAQNVALGLVKNVEYKSSVYGNRGETIIRNGYPENFNQPYNHQEIKSVE